VNLVGFIIRIYHDARSPERQSLSTFTLMGIMHVFSEANETKIDKFVAFYLFVCLFLARQPPVGQGLLIYEVSRSHTTKHHSR